MLPSKPIDLMTKSPIVARVRYPSLTGEAEGDLYRPASSGPHPGMVVCLGVVPIGVDHPQVARLGNALARAGFAALLYWSPSMRDLRLVPEDVDNIALAYGWLIDQPGIDSGRSGLLGTCVGGSFALMAAAKSTIRDRVGFVVAWAPYASIHTLACDIASATTFPDEIPEPWEVDQLTRRVYVRSLTAELEPDESTWLRTSFSEPGPVIDPPEFSPQGRAIFTLLSARDAPSAEAALKLLPATLLHRLDAMSPLNYLGEIRAPLLLLAHDRNDPVIPIAESHRLVAVLSGRSSLRYTEFTMFKHLDPTKVHLSKFALIRELARFCRAVYPIFRQSVG